MGFENWVRFFFRFISFLQNVLLSSLACTLHTEPHVSPFFFLRKCLTLLQGHTALVCQLQLTPTLLATGGSDGRVILFSLKHNTIVQRISAHDSSVTSIQLNDRFLVTGGNDGRVRFYMFNPSSSTSTSHPQHHNHSSIPTYHYQHHQHDSIIGDDDGSIIPTTHAHTGGTSSGGDGGFGGKFEYVREMSEVSESVWKVGFRRDVCAIVTKRAGKTVMEIWSFRD
ncbi:hypothetical protein C8Q75DRAFT_406484 [Abortiporus biennis]|nr:hypothetical protein C8Q75DRAFT_406484 [Abortiporus biennis]